MQRKKRSITIGLFLMLTTSIPICCLSQSKGDNADTSTDKLTQEDYEAMLAVNKMKVYKFPVKIPEDQKCLVVLYKQEFENQNMIKDENIFGSNSPHKKIVDMKPVYAEDGQNVYTPLDGIRLITKEDGENFTLGVKIGEFEIPSMPVKIDSAYNEKHFVKSFALPEEFPIGSEIPLVLIGSSWHATNIDETQEITKFCWGEYEGISPDFTEAGFNKMPHYILFGIRVMEPQ